MRLITELKRRNVFRVAAAYVVVAWLLLQAADILLSNFGAPEWVFKSFATLVVLGFPLALFLAWAYELTPGGIKKTREVPLSESIARYTGRKLDFVVIGVLALAVALLVFDKFVLSERAAPGPERVLDRTEASLDPSVAVLPFADMSAEGDQGYFADGLSEEILNLLARGGALRVTARTSSFSFKGRDVPVPEIGRTLGVAHVLEGSVRKSGDRLRITAQLIEAESGFHLWSESYDRPVQEIFAIQDEIAGAIASALEVTLTGRAAAPRDLEAYEIYLKARQLIYERRSEGLNEARELLDRALELDPDYAPALAASAELWLLMSAGIFTYGDLPGDQVRATAESLLERALSSDPELADAHAVSGLLWFQRGDYARAREHLERALAIHPSHVNANLWFANTLGHEGLLLEAIAARSRLRDVDPLFAVNTANLVTALADAGKFESAEAGARELTRQFPGDFYGYAAQVYVFLSQGRLADAHAAFEQALEIDSRVGLLRFWGDVLHLHLGAYDEWEEQSVGMIWIWAPIARGDIEVGLERGWQRLAVDPDSHPVIMALIDVMSVTGRHRELMDWMDQRWGSIDALSGQLGAIAMARSLLPVAAAQRALGRTDEFDQTLGFIAEKVEHFARNGYDNLWLDFSRFSFLALSGESERAIRKLADAIDGGFRDPWLARWPALESLQDEPEFHRQVERMNELINAERAKLGMGPLT